MEVKFKKDGNASYRRYAFGRQIYAGESYPLSAPNGSRIVVCGHDQGLLFVWTGGKPTPDQQGQGNQRGNFNQDVHMSDEETIAATDDEGGLAITHKLDLHLGTSVLHISFPLLQQTSRPQEVPLSPRFLQRDLVVALGCGDGSVRLLTLPLDPPSASVVEGKHSQQPFLGSQVGEGKWGEKMATIPNAHQNMPRGVSVAFAASATLDPQLGDNDDDDRSSVDALIASHSTDLSGTLLVHRIPVTNSKRRFGSPYVWRCRPLSSPACSIDMFVPPSGGSGPKILVGESSGSVRIFECTSAKHATGKWSLSLFVPVTKIMETQTSSLRSARWVLQGHAIAVLTADGGWGIWDVSEGSSGKAISGAKPTPFTISGRVGTIVGGSAAPKSSNEKVDTRTQLAPMTPSTRKARQENLFLGKADSSLKRGGGISVSHWSNSISTGDMDESLIFWYGDSVIYLLSLRTYWQNKFRGSGTVFTTSAHGHIRDIVSISLGEETRVSVSGLLVENPSTSSTSGSFSILVTGERSLTFSSSSSTNRVTPSNLSTTSQSRISDQSMLSRGTLDVNGLDRMLDGMQTDRSSSVPGASTHGQRRVLFQ